MEREDHGIVPRGEKMTEQNESVYSDLDEMNESSDVSGAMVCDYNTFKSLYRHSARAAIRGGSTAVIAMIKIADDDVANDSDAKQVFNHVGAAIVNALRRDDVVTGFDTSQYLILLTHLSVSDANKVLSRLIDRIGTTLGKELSYETSVEPILALT
jgi:PleD family two-component response regulator